MQLTMSFFLTESTAYLTMARWPSWIMPASLRARRTLNLCFTLLNTNSIGLYSGEYGTLNMNLKPNYAASTFDFSLRWAERLSKKRAIFSSPFHSRSSLRYCLNFCTFTELSNTLKCSCPFSFEMAERTARVGSFRCARSAVIFYFGRLNSVFGTVVRVKHISSIYIIR